jgi:hypothetical protein
MDFHVLKLAIEDAETWSRRVGEHEPKTFGAVISSADPERSSSGSEPPSATRTLARSR